MLKRLLAGALSLCALAVATCAFAQLNATAPAGYAPVQAQYACRLNTACFPLGGIVYAEASNRSLTITTGGTAQDLFPANTARNGFEVQNQSSDNCYMRSKGSLGTTVATQDQNSLMIYPGQYFSPQHISSYAYSIVCPSAGDAIYAREW